MSELYEYYASRKASDKHSHCSTEMKHHKQPPAHFLQNIPTELLTNEAYRTDATPCDSFLNLTLKATFKVIDFRDPDKTKVDVTCSSTIL
jgi:hypothetical protein